MGSNRKRAEPRPTCWAAALPSPRSEATSALTCSCWLRRVCRRSVRSSSFFWAACRLSSACTNLGNVRTAEAPRSLCLSHEPAQILVPYCVEDRLCPTKIATGSAC